MADLLIRTARLVATVDADRRELPGGWVAITGNLVEAVGASTDPAPAAAEVVDATDCLVTPGLVNTHHHIYQNLTRAHPPMTDKPLFGWQILLPRTKDPLTELEAALHSHGARTTQVATLSVEPPRTPQAMEKAISGIAGGRFGWIVFTCANSFNAVWGKLREYGLDARAFAGVQLAAVGDDTVCAMRASGLDVDLTPVTTTTELLDVFPEPRGGEESMDRVLIPRADIATETLAAGLMELGWEVEEVTAFRTVRSAPPPAPVREAIKGGGFDAVVFTSSATVRNLVGIAGKPHPRTLVVCIGQQTAQTAEEHGLHVGLIASEPSHAALVEGLVAEALHLQAEAFAAGQEQWRPRRSAGQRKAK